MVVDSAQEQVRCRKIRIFDVGRHAAGEERGRKQQAAILKSGLKKKALDQWANLRKQAIKTAMKAMGRTNEEYYPELAHCRRGMKKRLFTSLT